MIISELIITIATVMLTIFNGVYVFLLLKQMKRHRDIQHLETLERGLARIHDWMERDKTIAEEIEKHPESKSFFDKQFIVPMIIREAKRYMELYEKIYGKIP